MKKGLFLVLIFTTTCLFAYYQPKEPYYYTSGSTKTEITEKPAEFWWIFWTGAGDFANHTVSNTLQSGYFGRPPCGDYFDATFNQWVCSFAGGGDEYRGRTGEYPAGSEQFYVWAAGPWIGAMYPRKIEDGDTTWHARVSKGAYYSDMGGMNIPELEDAGEVGQIGSRGMAFSNQIIPYDLGFAHEGEPVFAQTHLGMPLEDYQVLWPFADTAVNTRRSDTATWVHPDTGDIISMEDTYACAGDWIPAKDAACIWVRDAGSYDLWGLGIRVEQRTYSWNYDYNSAYLFFNWKVMNMNNFPLKDVCVGYFMDNDVGSGIDAPQGSDDDMIGYDTTYIPELGRKLDLGYTYDCDGYEPDWATPAGYVGCVLLETPDDIGMTGFQYWTRVGEFGLLIDEDRQDSLKYHALSDRIPRWQVAGACSDMRQLSTSGPYPVLEPGETIEFTVAVLVGQTLDELKERVRFAIQQFENGYIGFSPPPSPELTVTPGDAEIYLTWDGTFSENYKCRMTGEYPFEGYKVYRCSTGLPDDWRLLATYDTKGSKTDDTVLVKYSKGSSKANISFVGYETFDSNDSIFHAHFGTKEYKITFTSPYTFVFDNLTDDKIYLYNEKADHRDSTGYYCIMDDIGQSPYEDDPGYVSGAVIYADGFYIRIQDGEILPDEIEVPISPTTGDEFMVWAYEEETVGEEIGLQHYYIDTDVINGMKYYYTTTSFSRPLPSYGVASLESGKTGTKYWAIPREEPIDWVGDTSYVKKLSGPGTGNIEVFVVDPPSVTGHSYQIEFIIRDTETVFFLPDSAYFVGSWRVIDTVTRDTVADDVPYVKGELSAPVIDGVLISVDAVTQSMVYLGKDVQGNNVYVTPETLYTMIDAVSDTTARDSILDLLEGIKVSSPTIDMYIKPELPTGRELLPYEYQIDFSSDSASVDMEGHVCKFKITNITRDITPDFVFEDRRPYDSTLNMGTENLKIYEDSNYVLSFKPQYFKSDIDTPTTGDSYIFKTIKPTTTLDKFLVSTAQQNVVQAIANSLMDHIRVVPNPYYISAPWDISGRSHRKVWFQGLPSQCTIRIYNVAGLLIRTIEHNEPAERNLRERNYKDGESVGSGSHAWDLLTEDRLEAVSGLYIYQVTTEKGAEKIGKFAIIK